MNTWHVVVLFSVFSVFIVLLLYSKFLSKNKIKSEVAKLKYEWTIILNKLMEYRGKDKKDVPPNAYELVERANNIQIELKKLDDKHVCQIINMLDGAHDKKTDSANDKADFIPEWVTGEETISIKVTIKIKYEDGGGVVTERVVDVKKYNHYQECFWGFCHLRNENRTFRTDRVKEVVDVETGEIVSGLKRFLRRHRVK